MGTEGTIIWQEQVRRITKEERGNLGSYLEYLIQARYLKPGKKQTIFLGYEEGGFCYIIDEVRFPDHYEASKMLRSKGYLFETSFYFGKDLMGYTLVEVWTK